MDPNREFALYNKDLNLKGEDLEDENSIKKVLFWRAEMRKQEANCDKKMLDFLENLGPYDDLSKIHKKQFNSIWGGRERVRDMLVLCETQLEFLHLVYFYNRGLGVQFRAYAKQMLDLAVFKEIDDRARKALTKNKLNEIIKSTVQNNDR